MMIKKLLCVYIATSCCALGGVASVSGLLVYKIDNIREVSDVLNSILKHIV